MAFQNLRRSLSLLIYPEWLYEARPVRPKTIDPYRKSRRAELLNLADTFVKHHRSTVRGCMIGQRSSHGYLMPNRTAEAVVRFKKNPETCPNLRTYREGCQWFSDHWLADIPRPEPVSELGLVSGSGPARGRRGKNKRRSAA